MSNKWIAVKVLAAPFYLEQLAAAIFALGAQGVQEEENRFVIFFAERDWNPDVYLNLYKWLSDIVPDFDESRLLVETQQEENWLEKWKQNFKPFKIGRDIVIVPDWIDYQAGQNELVLKIAPGMAFGTGHHETTQLCLLALQKYFRPGMRLLDAGTGSGILSIWAAKSGGSKILAIDNDPVAIDNAKENARLNGVQNKVRFVVQDVAGLPEGQFDFIVANINRNVLLEIAPGLTRALAKDGFLVLSGILKTDKNMVEKAYLKTGLKLTDQTALKEWQALIFKKEQVR